MPPIRRLQSPQAETVTIRPHRHHVPIFGHLQVRPNSFRTKIFVLELWTRFHPKTDVDKNSSDKKAENLGLDGPSINIYV
jgi:hypothetical protein